jgi:hypothetical protein
MQYPINEMFQTLQGEGYFTGVPAIFIRLQGSSAAITRPHRQLFVSHLFILASKL